MDNLETTLSENSQGHLDNINIKQKDHSPTRSSVKSFKANVGSKPSNKSIPKFAGNKLALKAENKSQISLTKTENQKVTNSKTTSPVTTKSPNSSTPTGSSMGKSKIPARKRSPLNNINTKTKTIAQQKSPGPKQQQQKPITQRTLGEKKSLELKRQPVTRSNSKSSISRSESSQINKMAASISKSSFVTSSAWPQQTKRVFKSQSARSSSESPVAVTNKRSVSNVSTRSAPSATKKTEYETNLRKMLSTAGDQKIIESLEINLQPKQLDLQQKNENLKDDQIDKFKTSESVDDFKNKIQIYMEQWFSRVKDELNDSKDDYEMIQEKLQNLQILKSHDILTLIDDFCNINLENNNFKIDKLRKELEESIESCKKEEKKYNDWIKQQKEERFKWEKLIEEKAQADIAKKSEEIKELQKKAKSSEKELSNLKATVQSLKKDKEYSDSEKDHLQADLMNSKESITNSNKKLQQLEQQLSHEKKELKAKTEIIKKLESDLEDKKRLEINLKEMSAKLEELEIKIKNKTHNECKEHLKQISELSDKVNSLEKDQEERQQENEKLQKELQELAEVKDKLKEAELKIRDQQKEYEAQEKSLEITPDCSKEIQLEFSKLRQSDQEKRREIEKLKVELSKAQFNICQLEQQIQRDQQLLEVRSELIKSLQANEKTHRIHMEELFAQVGEKNTTINELNCELQNKSEEFRNLFNNLSAKQVEVSNQEHIIKLLEESNERSQLLRVKQEEKIGRMEEELAHLKQTIAIYQANILSANQGKHLLLTPVLPPSNVDYNENFYYYVNQRKRKRQVDINVKKYEA